MKVIAVIGARLNSSRLEGKHLLDLHGKSLMQRVIDRLKHCRTLDKIILATTHDTVNRPLIEAVNREIEPFAYTGDVNDLLGRIDAVVKKESPDYLVYICGDCPLIEPGFIDHAVESLTRHPEKESIRLAANVVSIHEGMLFYSVKGWRRLVSVSTSAETREHVGLGDKINPTLDLLTITDSGDYSHPLHRISVDTVADYHFMKTIYQRWYQHHPRDSIVDLHWVQQQLSGDKGLSGINHHVQQKDPQKSYQKLSLYCHVSGQIGMGHLKRCAIIAECLQENLGLGTEITVQGERQTLPWLRTAHTWVEHEAELMTRLQQATGAISILDFHPDYINMRALSIVCEKIRPHRKIIALDKLTRLHAVVDAVFVPAFYADVSGPNIHCGWENYLLDPPRPGEKRDQLIVLTGGSDALAFGKVLPPLVESVCPAHWEMVWIQGPYATPPVFRNNERWQLRRNPSNLGELVASSKLAISAYGLSFFECLAARCVTFLLPAKRLTSRQELQALKRENTCTQIENLNAIRPDLKAYFVGDPVFNQRLANAERLTEKINGKKRLCQLVDSYVSR